MRDWSMAEPELRELTVSPEDLDAIGEGLDSHDVAELILARAPEISDMTREYLLMRGLADVLDEGNLERWSIH
ncbi:MAG TPA: hypothetical protein VI159_09360 [Gemmatimonadales bacterium]